MCSFRNITHYSFCNGHTERRVLIESLWSKRLRTCPLAHTRGILCEGISAIISVVYVDRFYYWSIYWFWEICGPFFPPATRWGERAVTFVQIGQAQYFYACETIPVSGVYCVRVRTPVCLHAALTRERRGAATDRQSHSERRHPGANILPAHSPYAQFLRGSARL